MFCQALTYGQASSSDNGNVASQTINATAAGTFTQHCRYDGANRLAVAVEGTTAPSDASSCPGGAVWCHCYGFEGFSNFWQAQRRVDFQSFLGTGHSGRLSVMGRSPTQKLRRGGLPEPASPLF